MLCACLAAGALHAAPTPTSTPGWTPTATVSPVVPIGSTLMLDPIGLALGAMKAERSTDAARDFKFLVGDDAYYLDLNRGLDNALGLARREPTDAEKRWAIVGAAVGYSCAAIAAAEATGLIPDKKRKRK